MRERVEADTGSTSRRLRPAALGLSRLSRVAPRHDIKIVDLLYENWLRRHGLSGVGDRLVARTTELERPGCGSLAVVRLDLLAVHGLSVLLS